MGEPTAREALASGKGFVDLASWRKIAVSGGDAFPWLNDLVSADISDLGPGRARRSLMLSPTGQVRAEFTVAVPGGNLVLLQDPAQTPVDALLSPYTLSSDVTLEDRTHELALFAFPGRTSPPDTPGTAFSAPSCAGLGIDLLSLAEDHDFLRTSLSKAYRLCDDDDLEAWRIAAGVPRLGVDGTEQDLPQESGFEADVSFDKGCYLGQEAVARVRNLGHPRRVLRHLVADGPVAAGDPVLAGDERAGEVTSAASDGGRWWAFARVAWPARDEPLRTAAGRSLTVAVAG